MSDDDVESERDYLSLIKKIVPVVIVVSLLIATVVFYYNFNGGSLDFSDREVLVIPTGSMDGDPQPYEISTIPVHSLIMVEKLTDEEKQELSVGDVVTFPQGKITVVHRIIEINDDGTIVTKGDANKSPDGPIDIDIVTGKVIGVAPNLGKVISSLRGIVSVSPVMIFIGFLLIFIIIVTIIQIVRIIRNNDEEKDDDD